MMKWIASVIASVVFLFSGSWSQADEKKYSIQDIEALVKNESWSELVQHLEDILPAKRDKKWQQIVEKGVLGYIETLNTDKNPFAALIMADRYTKRYSFLKKSKAFMAKRSKVGLKGFEECYDQSYGGGECSDRFLPFVEGDLGNVDLSLKAGQLVILKQHHYFAIPFFRHAVVWAKGSKKVCEADRLWDSLMAALKLPTSYKKLVPAAQEVCRTCWPTMKEDLINRFDEGGSYYQTNLCPVLKEKKSPLASKCGGVK